MLPLVLQYRILPLYREVAMSEKRPTDEIHAEIAADWWVLAGALEAELLHEWAELAEHMEGSEPLLPLPRLYGKLLRQGYTVDIYGALPARPLTTIVFEPQPQGTRIHILAFRQQRRYWERKVEFLAILHERTQAIHQLATPDYDTAIERFYRMRAQHSRVTLRQIAEDAGLSYAALRKRKMAYDRRGGYGAGKRAEHRETGK